MLKRIKLVSTVLLTLTFIPPVQASESWLSKLFPTLSSWEVIEAQGGSNGGGNPSIPDPIVNANSPVYTPSGGGNSGGNPSIPDKD